MNPAMALEQAWDFLKADIEDIRDAMEAQHAEIMEHRRKYLRPNQKKLEKPSEYERDLYSAQDRKKTGKEKTASKKDRGQRWKDYQDSFEDMDEWPLRPNFGIQGMLNRVDLNEALASIGERSRAKQGFVRRTETPGLFSGSKHTYPTQREVDFYGRPNKGIDRHGVDLNDPEEAAAYYTGDDWAQGKKYYLGPRGVDRFRAQGPERGEE